MPGLVKEERPALSPYGTCPAQDSRPRPLPKGNSPTMSCSKNSSGCHLRGERNLSLPPGSPLPTRDRNLMAVAVGQLWRARVCAGSQGAWDRPVLLPHFTFQETAAGGQETGLGPWAQQWQCLARTRPPKPTPYPHGQAKELALQALPTPHPHPRTQNTDSRRRGQTSLGGMRGPSLTHSAPFPPTLMGASQR